jgi:hypothetical protein
MASNRVYDKSSGLNLQTYQRNAANSGLSHQVISIPSDTAASFGNYFTISLRETNVFVHQLLLQFTANAVAGMTTSPRYTPAPFWISRIELFSSGTVIDTLYPSEIHILNNLFWDDADRMSINKSAGHYANVAQRAALAASTSTYYVNLRSFIDQLHIPLLTANHNIQLRVYMDTLANNTVASSGTATNTGVTACNLIARVSRIEQSIASQLLQEMSVRPFDNFFHQTRLFSTTVTCSSTSSSTRMILAPVVGSVAFMFFTVRDTSNLNKDNYFTYKEITSFAFLDGAGQNIVGGSQLPHAIVKDTLMREQTLSNYCTEDNSSLLSSYLTGFNGSNAYMYSWSSDPISAFKTGSLLGARRFNGTEILEVYFSATGTYQIDAFFFTENVLRQTPAGISISSV